MWCMLVLSLLGKPKVPHSDQEFPLKYLDEILSLIFLTTFIEPVSHPIVHSAWYTRYCNLVHTTTSHVWFVEDIVLFNKHYSTSWHKHSMLEILLNMVDSIYISHTNFYQGKVSVWWWLVSTYSSIIIPVLYTLYCILGYCWISEYSPTIMNYHNMSQICRHCELVRVECSLK